jgi:hypothetical protein
LLEEKHGMKNISYWTPMDEPQKSNTLIYILAHPSREAAAANWKAFSADPEWQSVQKASEANGKIVEGGFDVHGARRISRPHSVREDELQLNSENCKGRRAGIEYGLAMSE